VIRRSPRPRPLGELARALGLLLRGGGEDLLVHGAAPLDKAGPADLAALYDPRFVDAARASRAGALVVPEDVADRFPDRPVLPAAAPKAVFARAIHLLYPEPSPEPGVDPRAVVGRDVVLGEGVAIGPLACIGDGCRLGNRVVVGPGAVLLPGVTVGEDTRIHPGVVVYPGTEIGRRCRLLAGAVIGAPGFGVALDADGTTVRLPQLGRVVLEDDVEIGANTTVDRAMFGETRIGAGTRLDNLVQVGHNVRLGRNVLVAAQTGFAGSSSVGDGTLIGAQAGVGDHVRVGTGAVLATRAGVLKDVADGAAVAGFPAMPLATWRRVVTILRRLPEAWRRLGRRGGGREKEEGREEA